MRIFALLLLLAACRDPRPDAGGEVATRADSAGHATNEQGLEFEAPRLIPSVRAQMAELRQPEGATESNLSAFSKGARTLVEAMGADLRRVGTTDTGYFSALGDSVIRRLEGAGSASPDLGWQAAPQVERLIEHYEDRMREAAH